MADKREQLAEVFRDTQAFLKENRVLAEAAEKSTRQTKLYTAQDYRNCFDRIEFAIYGKGRSSENYDAFYSCFFSSISR